VIGVIDQQIAERASYVKFKSAPAEAAPSAPSPRG
jgi:hypothetical protein